MAFTLSDTVRLTGTAYEGPVTYAGSQRVQFEDSGTGSQFVVSKPDELLERAVPDVKAGDIWEDQDGQEWVVLASRDSTLTVAAIDRPSFYPYTTEPGAPSAMQVGTWQQDFKPRRVRRRDPQ